MRPTGKSSKSSARSDYWRDLLQQQSASGQSVSAFCSKRGLTEQSFYFWKKRLSKQAPVSFSLVAANEFVDKRSTSLELELGSGQRLRIPMGVDAATLRTVLSVLREPA